MRKGARRHIAVVGVDSSGRSWMCLRLLDGCVDVPRFSGSMLEYFVAVNTFCAEVDAYFFRMRLGDGLRYGVAYHKILSLI